MMMMMMMMMMGWMESRRDLYKRTNSPLSLASPPPRFPLLSLRNAKTTKNKTRQPPPKKSPRKQAINLTNPPSKQTMVPTTTASTASTHFATKGVCLLKRQGKNGEGKWEQEQKQKAFIVKKKSTLQPPPPPSPSVGAFHPRGKRCFDAQRRPMISCKVAQSLRHLSSLLLRSKKRKEKRKKRYIGHVPPNFFFRESTWTGKTRGMGGRYEWTNHCDSSQAGKQHTHRHTKRKG
ncbi:hypothetical protein BS50DRAFT_264999 [Corynespora cassiicola Philippines]|uniref:Uncharacterized protein n=1 Tax=Corynespora cassiicola Philippines TaxID=1448308 RepID=A0A2T2NYX1_CORCC|nr:hypothetical protein BS50DRAFT_264999 [Corynespora cassiicola Philippines]